MTRGRAVTVIGFVALVAGSNAQSTLRLADGSVHGVTTNSEYFVVENLDGRLAPELVAATSGARFADHWNDGSGRYSIALSIPQSGLMLLVQMDGDPEGEVVEVGLTGVSAYDRQANGLYMDISSRVGPVTPMQNPLRIMVTDVNNDGWQDVVGLVSLSPTGRAFVLLNDGAGRLPLDPRGVTIPGAGAPQGAWWVDASDLDGDGDQDLVFVGNTTQIYTNDGTGLFAQTQVLPGYVGSSNLGDLDGDGDVDLLFAPFGFQTLSGVPEVYLNDGTGQFARAPQVVPRQVLVHLPRLVDLDLDGDLDLLWCERPVVRNGRTVLMHEFVNDGTGSFTDVTDATLPDDFTNWTSVRELTIADLDLDGDPDVLMVMNSANAGPKNPAILWNLTRQVTQAAPPRLGLPWTVEHHGRSGHLLAPAASFALRPTSLPGLGLLALDPSTIVTGVPLPIPPAGVAPLTLTVPNDARLAGVTVFWQALDVDPVNLSSSRLTNALAATIGR